MIVGWAELFFWGWGWVMSRVSYIFWITNFMALDFGTLVVFLAVCTNLGAFMEFTWLGLGLGLDLGLI
jgi:hypothetical protein